MQNPEHETKHQLAEHLQVAALSLLDYLQTNNFRVLIKGSVPPVYITVSEGRFSDNSKIVPLEQWSTRIDSNDSKESFSFLLGNTSAKFSAKEE